MTAPRLVDLFAWEWRQAGRSPLLWAVLLTLAAAMVWAAVGTAALHRTQAEAQARTVAAAAAHRTGIEQRAAAYRAAPTADAPVVPYWQDPTNVSGFSQYFLLEPALKPHLPLSPLAAGVSDVAPSRLTIKLNTLFGFDDSYDFENPRGLALGRFDLGLVLAYLLPVALILLFGLLVTFERDRGMLRLVAAQAASPRRWLAARIAAILAWAAPAILLGLLVALAAAGVDLAAVVPELAAALGLVLAYALFWTGIATIVLARLPGAAAALGSLAAIWAVLAIGLPLLVATLTSLAPAPSPIAWVDAQRRVADQIEAERDALLTRAFQARPELAPLLDRLTTIDHATRLSFLVPEAERRLTPLHDALRAHAEGQARIAAFAGFAAPPLGLEAALATLAGTDPARHRRFETAARAYQLQLRDHVYPLVQREIAATPPPAEPLTRGRFSFVGYNTIPKFAFADLPASARAQAASPTLAWLALLGALLIGVGLSRARRWPASI